ncbi:pqn-26 [Pristionchus pacificus]|uniref:Pqn-26 n=1 Tax=Pristionchus pacificus TaxID=54126 RepID=A0A2A6BN34_PRIPA|nr:pqn-26 [Pristionchus pacificus]|eukprot:PDM67171.1 pqn-26 [Pristionchus pacificus]
MGIVRNLDETSSLAAETRLAAEAAQSAALKAAAASSAAAAHAAAFRKVIKRNVNLLLQDPDLAKYQQYLDILRAHYGIQLPMHPNVAAQQSNPGVPRVQTYPVASMVTRPSPSPSSYSKYSTTPTSSNYYPQQGGVTQSSPQQPDSSVVAPSQSSYPQEYLPRQPAPVQRPIETPRPRPADPRDYGYAQQVQQPMEQTRVDGAMTGSPMEWWERVSSAIAHEISSVTTTPKYIVPIIPATTVSPRPAPSPIPMQPQENHGYAPAIPSSPLVPINPVEPPRMISQQPPVIYTGAGTDSFPTPGDLPTPSFTPPPIPHTTVPTPSPTTRPPPPPTQSIVHPSSIQTPHASVSATAPPVPQPKSIKPTTKEGKAAATSREALAEQIRSLPAVLYTRSSTSKRVEKILRSKGLPLVALYIDKVEGREGQIEKHLEHLTGSSTMPYLFICGTYIGSEEHVEEYDKKGQMEQLVEYVCKGSKETKKKNKKDKRKKNE